MGQLSVTGVKWKEINLGCLHGKMVREWERSGCWIWGYEGINHTSTCAWNTCGAFVQNSPKMPIRWIKVMECPPSPPPPNSTLTNPLSGTLWKITIFVLVKFGYAWALLHFLGEMIQRSVVVVFGCCFFFSHKSLLKNPQPFHFRYPMVNRTRFQNDSWTKRLIALVNHSLEKKKKILQIFHSLPGLYKSHTCVRVCVCRVGVYRASPIPGNRICKTC